MSWKNPPSDITLELAAGSPLSKHQVELQQDIQKVYEKHRRNTSLRVYVLGYEKRPNTHRRKKKA